mgnify:CR=1 FL=1
MHQSARPLVHRIFNKPQLGSLTKLYRVRIAAGSSVGVTAVSRRCRSVQLVRRLPRPRAASSPPRFGDRAGKPWVFRACAAPSANVAVCVEERSGVSVVAARGRPWREAESSVRLDASAAARWTRPFVRNDFSRIRASLIG